MPLTVNHRIYWLDRLSITLMSKDTHCAKVSSDSKTGSGLVIIQGCRPRLLLLSILVKLGAILANVLHINE